ncbi:MAG: DUF3516 domain-containing protein [Myxococcales bacterium]|nr:DUF3516 domain-containing protein [Myxococcales bacterium]
MTAPPDVSTALGPTPTPASATLAELLPATCTPSTLLDAFLTWTTARGLTLHTHQEEALLALAEGHHLVLATPTGSGKSLVATALHFFALGRRERSVYTSPVKALVNEKFFQLCHDFGPACVGLATGDASVNRDAPILCCTAEILANDCLRRGADADFDQVVMDEFHWYADRDRGMAWQVPLLVLEHATFLLMSATLGDTTTLQADLARRSGRPVAVVTSAHRPVPLHFSYSDVPLLDQVQDLLKEGKAPAYVVHFSQREATETAAALLSVPVADKEGKRAIAAALREERWPTPYGKDLRRLLLHGVGVHHGGLLPRYRRTVERLGQQGLLPVICGTDTLGVGVNLPLRTVLLTKLCKFDGEHARLLQVRELLQIAGRAGRMGFDTEGFVVSQAPEHVIWNRRQEAKTAKDGRPKAFVRQKPPERGFVLWTRDTFDKLVTGKPEVLASVFRIEAGHLMTVLHRGQGVGPLCQLIGKSHERPYVQLQLRRDLARLFRSLRLAGVVTLVPRAHKPGRDVEVAGGLQRDFSLHHTLSLWLVDALQRLQHEYAAAARLDMDESYALDVVGLCEAILENPTAILLRQQSRAKGELVAALKADGVPYEERMERLEHVTWPKPNADWIYATFEDFCVRHPWVAHEAIRPKAVAREMADVFTTFEDYVKDLDLEPMEGVLLRHLSQVWRTLQQNVPEARKTEAVHAIIGWLRALIGRVDSSLVQEWEALADPEAAAQRLLALQTGPVQTVAVDVARDVKAFHARLRAELRLVMRALALGQWEQAAAGFWQGGPAATDAESAGEAGDGATWAGGIDPDTLRAAVARFVAEHGPLTFAAQARLGDAVQIAGQGRRRWRVLQTLYAGGDDTGWRLEAGVDLTGDAGGDGPLLRWVGLGPGGT